MCGGRWFFLRLRGQYLRGKNPDDYAKTALGEDPSGPFVFFQPGDFGWKLAMAAPLKEASPLKCFADVRFVPSSQSIPPDGNAVAELPAIPFPQFLRRR